MHTACSPNRPSPSVRSRGFTLIELLVALGIMALMTILSWRGLDAMTRAQTHIQERGDALLTLQAGLTQWTDDLDAQVQLPQMPALDWDGHTLRMTRYSTHAPGEGLIVVAWTQRTVNGTAQWLRWQSPPVTTQGALQIARERATQWGKNPGDEERKYEVVITAIEQWQVFYYRNGAWSAASPDDPTAATASVAPVAVQGAPPATPAAKAPEPVPMDGVRLVLTLPPGEALNGTLTRDWLRATLGPGRP